MSRSICISLIVALSLAAKDSIPMRSGTPFKVALFADLHFGEDSWTEWGPMQDLKSLRVMSNVLDQEQPDFVVYLGDVITANNMMLPNASLYWEQAISPVRDRGIPWCSVFGNHDDASFEWPLEWFSGTGFPPVSCPAHSSGKQGVEFCCSSGSCIDFAICFVCYVSCYGDCSFEGTTRLELMRNEIDKNALSYSKIGHQNMWPGVSNYILKISSADSKHAVAYFYFFDSGGGSYPEVISAAQVNWFQQESMNLNPNSSVPEIIFWHIPSESYQNVAPQSNGEMKCVGSIFAENVAAQQAELGIMQVLQQRTSAKAVFVGHNHGLDWCCPHKNLWLCFARHTGYGGYGNWARGSRIIEIKQHPFSLKTWITMEDGSSHSEVILTYIHPQ